MTDKTQTTMPGWLCDEPGCDAVAVIGVGTRSACYRHALERGNAARAERGLTPLVFDDEGEAHVCQ